MQTSSEGKELIKRFESFSAKPYLCPAGVATIGYGSTDGVTLSMKPITQSEGERLLTKDLRWVDAAINKHVKVPLSQNQHDALASFVFNVGEAKFAKSTLLKLLNKGQYDEVPAQLRRWVHAKGKKLKGLERRRDAEVALWGRTDEPEDAGEMPQAVDAPEKPLAKSRTVANASLAGAVGTAMVAAPAIEPAGEVVRIAQENPQGLLLVLGIVLIVFAAVAIYLRMDQRRKGRA